VRFETAHLFEHEIFVKWSIKYLIESAGKKLMN